jgi:DNA-binding CsgD family transcriptional regulator
MAGESYCLVPAPLPARTGFPFDVAVSRLTSEERRVLEWVCAGYSNKEIAVILDKAVPTVKNQVASCLHKLGQPSRTRLIAALR